MGWDFLGPDEPLQPDEGDAYELRVLKDAEPPGPGTEYMLDVVAPGRFRRLFRTKTKVKLWTHKDRKWRLVALFVSPHAALEYAQIIATKITEAKNAAVRKETK